MYLICLFLIYLPDTYFVRQLSENKDGDKTGPNLCLFIYSVSGKGN